MYNINSIHEYKSIIQKATADTLQNKGSIFLYYVKRDERPMSFPHLPDNFLYHEFLQYQANKVVDGYKIMAKDYKEKQKLQNQLLRINTAIRSIKQISKFDKKQEGKLMKLKKQ